MKTVDSTYREEDVRVVAVPSSLRLDEPLAQLVATRWQKMKEDAEAKDQQIWDDPMQRYEAVYEEAGALVLEMSRIYFSQRAALRTLLIEKQTDVISYGSYVHCIIKTQDDWYVFGVKSGRYYADSTQTFIGGVLDYEEERPRTPFEVAKNELHEEAGISSESIRDLRFVGTYISDHGSIGFMMAVEVSLTKEQLLAGFAKKTDQELASLEFIRPNKTVEYVRETLKRGKNEVALVQKLLSEEMSQHSKGVESV